MLKIDFKVPFINEQGKPLKEIRDGKTVEVLVNEILAHFCFKSKDSDYMKFDMWAHDLYKKGYIEIDEADYNKLVYFIETNENMTEAGYKAQIIRLMQKAKEQKK